MLLLAPLVLGPVAKQLVQRLGVLVLAIPLHLQSNKGKTSNEHTNYDNGSYNRIADVETLIVTYQRTVTIYDSCHH